MGLTHRASGWPSSCDGSECVPGPRVATAATDSKRGARHGGPMLRAVATALSQEALVVKHHFGEVGRESNKAMAYSDSERLGERCGPLWPIVRKLSPPPVNRASIREADRRAWSGPVRAALFTTLAGLSGCSAVQLAYDNFDRWLASKADHYLELTPEQSERARDLAIEAMEIHRSKELPRWAHAARDLRATLEDGLTPEEAVCLRYSLLDLYRRSVAVLADYASAVLSDASPGQILALESGLDADDERFHKRFVGHDADHMKSYRVERVHRWMERWVGKLLDHQSVWLAHRVRAYPSMAKEWARYHSRQRTDLVRRLRGGASRAELRGFLIEWWTGEASKDPSFARAAERSWSAILEIALGLDGMLMSVQRNEVLDRLDSVDDDLRALLDEETTPPDVGRCAARQRQAPLE